MEVQLLNTIKPMLSVSRASPDYATLRATAMRERSEVYADNSPEEALRREKNALRAGRAKHSTALKELLRSFQRIRTVDVRNQLMKERVGRMKSDLSSIKRAKGAAHESRRRARQARARAVAERVNMASVRARFGATEGIRRDVQSLHFDETKEQANLSFRSIDAGTGIGYDEGDGVEDEDLGGTSQDERDAAEDEGSDEETEEDRVFTTAHAADVARLR